MKKDKEIRNMNYLEVRPTKIGAVFNFLLTISPTEGRERILATKFVEDVSKYCQNNKFGVGLYRVLDKNYPMALEPLHTSPKVSWIEAKIVFPPNYETLHHLIGRKEVLIELDMDLEERFKKYNLLSKINEKEFLIMPSPFNY